MSMDTDKVTLKVCDRFGASVGVTVERREHTGDVSIGIVSGFAASVTMTPADALALAEALEDVARPMLPGGVATFRDAVAEAVGGGE
jgi:hypothetical protein